MNQKIRDRELEKLYLCTVLGRPTPSAGTLEGFIVKDEAKKQVSIRSKPVPGGRKAITKYRTLATKGNLSLVECDLITGRTHQIRAMMAHAGHPLLGDGKYGSKGEPPVWPQASGALELEAHLSVHHRCGGTGLPERTQPVRSTLISWSSIFPALRWAAVQTAVSES